MNYCRCTEQCHLVSPATILGTAPAATPNLPALNRHHFAKSCCWHLMGQQIRNTLFGSRNKGEGGWLFSFFFFSYSYLPVFLKSPARMSFSEAEVGLSFPILSPSVKRMSEPYPAFHSVSAASWFSIPFSRVTWRLWSLWLWKQRSALSCRGALTLENKGVLASRLTFETNADLGSISAFLKSPFLRVGLQSLVRVAQTASVQKP